MTRKAPPPTHYLVLATLENEHAQSFQEAFHWPGTILVERGIIAPCLAPTPPEE